MRNFLLYGHGGSYNHGAEAIVRTTVQMIRNKYPDAYIALSSHFPEQDREFVLDTDAIYGPDEAVWTLEKKAVNVHERHELARSMYVQALNQIDHDTVCLSVGGDVFCYSNWHRLAVFQEKSVEVGAKTILWGCSVEPSAITPKMFEVLRSYDTIVTRESITFDVLSEHGLSDRLLLAPDTAFNLQPVTMPLPAGLVPERTVGINISPLIIRRESKPGILMDNILLLIHYIVTQIGYDVMLIPHVVMPADNDFEFLSDLWNGLPEAEKRRTYLLDGNHSSSEYKYAVSQCAMLVCARTHVSIAAYSLGIPTLVLGYSVKAQGIALDLGMTDYVLDITKIKEASVVTEMFKHLYKDQDHICAHLKYRLPTYMADMVRVYEII